MASVNDVEDYYDKTMHFGYRDETTAQAVITNVFLQGSIVCILRTLLLRVAQFGS